MRENSTQAVARPASSKQPVPPTENPGASEMNYTPAPPTRDIVGRMSEYGKEAKEEDALKLDLSAALRQGQRSSREYLSAEEDYILAAIRLLIERHLWGPRLFNDTSVSLAGSGDAGDFQHALSVINTLKATQRLPYGGSVEAKWIVDATEQLRAQASGRYTQASSLAFSGTIPLLRGAGDVAREDLIQAERNLVYAARTFERFRRQFLVNICADYFRLVQVRATIANAQRQLRSLQELEKSTAARVSAGRIDAFQTSVASSRVLAAQAGLIGLSEQFRLQVDLFKIRLGLPVEQAISLGAIDLDIPDPEVDVPVVVALAQELRLDFQNRRDQLDDARRRVANARNALLPDLSATASVTVPTDPAERVGGLAISPDDLRYSAGLDLSLPLDRENERLSLRESLISLAQRERSFDEARDTIVVRVRSALRNVDVARAQFSLAEKQVEINRRRLEGQKLKAESLVPQTLVDSLNELLDAENNRDRAQTDLRNAILNYLVESDQLRVTKDGLFDPLPGMEGAKAP